MIVILSPAKNMRRDAPKAGVIPQFIDRSQLIIEKLRQYQPWELEGLLKVNPPLALKAYNDYIGFGDGSLPGTVALLTYKGLVYQYMKPETFSKPTLRYAQKHLRILSGLYGLLKPLDGIVPYRLEMQTPLDMGAGNLYHFWGDSLYRELYQESKTLVINLASQEYAKTISRYLRPTDTFINIDFLSRSKGRLVTLATIAKMARGVMAAYILEHRLQRAEELQNFSWEGFCFDPNLSSHNHMVFIQN